MKVTIEVPDELYYRVKAQAALKARTVREVSVELYQRWLGDLPPEGTGRTPSEWVSDWVALGAEVVEVHLTFSRECFGPDVESSLTTEQLRQLVEGVRFLETAMANPVDKDQVCRELQDVRRLFTKSIVAEADLPAGTVLNDWHVGLRKPGTGLPADLLGRVVGQRLARAVTRGQFLAEEDFASPVMRELQGQS